MSAETVGPVGRVYGGATSSQRQAARRERLIRAGLELFGTKGIAATRVDDICHEAGLTKRYFYESFSSLDDVLEAVLAEAISNLARTVVPAVTEHGWINPRPAIEALLLPLLTDPRLVRLLLIESNNGALAIRRQEMIDLAVDTWLQSDIHADRDPANLPSQRLLAHAMAGATADVAFAWVSGRLDMPIDEVVDHLVRIFNRITPRRPPG